MFIAASMAVLLKPDCDTYMECDNLPCFGNEFHASEAILYYVIIVHRPMNIIVC